MSFKIVSVEGNIGAGKSTFLSALENKLGHRQDVCFLQEPIEEWKLITDENSTTILERFYKDKIKFSFPFQIMAYITRLSNLKKAYENPQYKYIFTDRSLFTDKCVFTQMLYDDGEINEIEYKIYNRWFLEFIDFSNTFRFVYLQTSPEKAFERVCKRARKGESIPIDYLAKCHEYHEKWLTVLKNVTIIDANQENTESVISNQIKDILLIAKQHTNYYCHIGLKQY